MRWKLLPSRQVCLGRHGENIHCSACGWHTTGSKLLGWPTNPPKKKTKKLDLSILFLSYASVLSYVCCTALPLSSEVLSLSYMHAFNGNNRQGVQRVGMGGLTLKPVWSPSTHLLSRAFKLAASFSSLISCILSCCPAVACSPLLHHVTCIQSVRHAHPQALIDSFICSFVLHDFLL